MPPTQQTPARLIERPALPHENSFSRGFGAIGGTAAKEGRGSVLQHADAQFLADVEAVGNDPAFFAAMGARQRERECN